MLSLLRGVKRRIGAQHHNVLVHRDLLGAPDRGLHPAAAIGGYAAAGHRRDAPSRCLVRSPTGCVGLRESDPGRFEPWYWGE
jgi:hypothetical protein